MRRDSLVAPVLVHSVARASNLSGAPQTAIATVAACMIAAAPPATAGDSSLEAKGTQAEIQIGLCAPINQVLQALDAHPRAPPIDVWQFDDAALTLLEGGCAFAFEWQPPATPNSP